MLTTLRRSDDPAAPAPPVGLAGDFMVEVFAACDVPESSGKPLTEMATTAYVYYHDRFAPP